MKGDHHGGQSVSTEYVDVEIGSVITLFDSPLHVGPHQLKQENFLVGSEMLEGARVEFLHVVEQDRVHVRQLKLNLLHCDKHLVQGILGLLAPLSGLRLHPSQVIRHHRLHQLILVGEKLIQGLLTHAQTGRNLVHRDSADPPLHEQRMGKSDDPCVGFHGLGAQNYGNYFSCQSFQILKSPDLCHFYPFDFPLP